MTHSTDDTQPTLAGDPDALIEIRPGRHLAVQIHAGGRHRDTTVFLCHGAGGSKYQWREQWHALIEAGYRIVAWDFPGHGRSPRPRARKTYAGEAFVADLIALISRYRSERNYLVAHSYGVLLSLAALAALPEAQAGAIEGALLLGSPAPRQGLGKSWLFALPSFVLEHLRPKLAQGFRTLAWHPEADPALVAFEEIRANENPMHVFKALVRQAQTLEDVALQKLALPFVLLSGDHDGITPLAGARELASALPDAVLHTLRRCGHQIMLERPEETNAWLLKMLPA